MDDDQKSGGNNEMRMKKMFFLFFFLIHVNFNLLKTVRRYTGLRNAVFKSCTSKSGIIKIGLRLLRMMMMVIQLIIRS